MDLTHLRIRRLELDDTRLLFTLDNGMRIDEPIQAQRLLAKATPAQRAQWQLTDDSHGVNWPAVAPPSAQGLLNMPMLLWRRRTARAQARLVAVRGRFDALTPGERELVALARLDADMSDSGYARYFDHWDALTRGARCRRSPRWVQARCARRSMAWARCSSGSKKTRTCSASKTFSMR